MPIDQYGSSVTDRSARRISGNLSNVTEIKTENAIIKINDEATPFLAMVAQNFPKELSSALKSAGWWMSKNIKDGIKSGAPGGRKYKPLSNITKKLSKARRPQILGKLRQLVRYKYYADSNRVVIGWLNPNIAEIAEKQEQGYRTPITDAKRRMFAAEGIILPAKKAFFEIPKRETISPIYQQYASQVPEYLENKVWERINKKEKTYVSR